ncbi:type VII secretion target [Lentzea sp. NPDC051838]|uniref:type VII secretion target n=1 Tax=Lentzea sp. NPDC051838 TaxID=3154849 RepID=UPI0034388006
MSQAFHVTPEELRKHAANVEAVKNRFAAVKSASAHIQRNDQAFGLMCAWMTFVLDARHTTTDNLIAYAQENLDVSAYELRATADHYEGVDSEQAVCVDRSGGSSR